MVKAKFECKHGSIPFLSETCEGLICEVLFINTWQVVRMANKESRKEVKEVLEEEVTVTPDMKVMYKDFLTQF